MEHITRFFLFVLNTESMKNVLWLLELMELRKRALKAEIKKFPQYADILSHKLHEIESDMQTIRNRDEFEALVLKLESVLDECEAELDTHG